MRSPLNGTQLNGKKPKDILADWYLRRSRYQIPPELAVINAKLPPCLKVVGIVVESAGRKFYRVVDTCKNGPDGPSVLMRVADVEARYLSTMRVSVAN